MRTVLSELTVAYLFLGGLGAGALGVASLFDVLLVRQPFGTDSRGGLEKATRAEQVVGVALVVGLVALLAGTACLLLDLGRMERALSLFLSPTLSYISLGAYALVALAVVAAFVVVARLLYVPELGRRLVTALEWVAVALALVVAFYTGLLLQGTVGVAFWRSACVPALFLLSSASCGLAVLLAACGLLPHDQETYKIARISTRCDVVLLATEALVALAFVVTSLSSANPAARQSAETLFSGEMAAFWWLGFVGLGIVLPLVFELMFACSSRGRVGIVVLAVVAVLVGGIFLRFDVAEAGAHRAMELQSATAAQLSTGAAAIKLSSGEPLVSRVGFASAGEQLAPSSATQLATGASPAPPLGNVGTPNISDYREK